MLSDTLKRGLEPYAIGPKLRALRLRKKMGLVELGRHTGLSPALLSKIERGRLVPTLPTLLRIALVFSVGLEHFFITPAQPTIAVVRRSDRNRFPEKLGDVAPGYFFESLDFPALERPMNSYYVEFEGPASRPHQHPGVELVYVIEGSVVITVESTEHSLGAGDSMYFDASVSHHYQRSGRKRCRAIVVTA